MRKKTLQILILLVFPSFLIAQKIDNMASFRDIKSDSYFRYNYDNDYFASTDHNYTQGYNFELVTPFLLKNPLNYLFVKTKNSESKYGISIEHIGYTPNDIGSAEIQLGDRPFVAAIMIKSFKISTDTIQKTRLVSSLNVGIIGPGAFGKEMQTAIHEFSGNTIPQGWHHQIKNDVVLNYEISHEKQLLRFRNFLTIQSNATARFGTLFTNVSLGGNATIGLINAPFTSVKNKNKFQLYAFVQSFVTAVGYDATLQGGVFNDKSPYTIPDNEMKRLVAQNNIGFILQTRSLFFEYTRTAITREYESGHSSKSGGLKIGFKF